MSSIVWYNVAREILFDIAYSLFTVDRAPMHPMKKDLLVNRIETAYFIFTSGRISTIFSCGPCSYAKIVRLLHPLRFWTSILAATRWCISHAALSMSMNEALVSSMCRKQNKMEHVTRIDGFLSWSFVSLSLTFWKMMTVYYPKWLDIRGFHARWTITLQLHAATNVLDEMFGYRDGAIWGFDDLFSVQPESKQVPQVERKYILFYTIFFLKSCLKIKVSKTMDCIIRDKMKACGADIVFSNRRLKSYVSSHMKELWTEIMNQKSWKWTPRYLNHKKVIIAAL